jgi:putative CocE/NonD family hydrolase
MPAAGGVRLATRVLRPADASVRRGTVLIRSERPIASFAQRAAGERRPSGVGGRGAPPVERFARWLAEDGRTVAIQSCRGRGESEGEFRPFADEIADGGDALRWIAGQPWFDGELVLLGMGYSAFAAWAALSTGPVAAIAAGFGARDPYAWLHRGGVLQLEAALSLAARLDGRAGHDPSALDLARAARHRPLGECDRVALRELAAFRDWIAHPEPDAWWSERTPALPQSPPRALFVSGWYECAFPAAWSDFEALAARAAERGSAAPELLLGPWGAAPLTRAERTRGTRDVAVIARALLRFVARAVGARAVRDLPARVFVRGAGWRESASWPPAASSERTLYLCSDGHANSAAGDGRLTEEPGADRADKFVADPADPVPSQGGAAVGDVAGAVDQRDVEERGDLLCFTSEPLSAALELAGRVRLTLHTAGPARAEDTSAKLVAVEPNGAARWLAEGITRAPSASFAQRAQVSRSEPQASEDHEGGERRPSDAFEVELGVAGARLAPGTRLRVEVAGSSLPRFARSEPDAASVRTVYHGRARASALHFYAAGPPALHQRARLDSRPD